MRSSLRPKVLTGLKQNIIIWFEYKRKELIYDTILRIVCRSNSEQQIRTLFVQEVLKESFLLQSIESEDIQGTDTVEVKAFILANGQQDAMMEKIVGMLSLHQAVSAASWKHVSQAMEE